MKSKTKLLFEIDSNFCLRSTSGAFVVWFSKSVLARDFLSFKPGGWAQVYFITLYNPKKSYYNQHYGYNDDYDVVEEDSDMLKSK